MRLSLLTILFLTTLSSWAQSTLTDGLVAHYPFTGNAGDSSGNGNHATVSGATLATDRFGNTQSCYSFDGVDDYMEVTNTTALNASSTELSIALWANITSFTGTPPKGVMLDKANGNFGDWGMYYGDLDPSGTERLRHGGYVFIGPAGGTYLVQGYWTTTLPVTSQWVHLVITFNGNGYNTYYINGESESAFGNGGNPWVFATNTANLLMGKSYQGTDFYNGLLDDVRIYNRELTEAEVCELYTGSDCSTSSIKSITANDPVSMYPNPATSSTIVDHKEEIKSATIMDPLGKVVQAKLIGRNEIELEGLEAGIYILEINFSNGFSTRERIIKL